MSNFYPRPPRGGRRNRLDYTGMFLNISIHALREEGDISTSSRTGKFRYFYPRPPRGGRQRRMNHAELGRGISIHALREEGDPETWRVSGMTKISIHALREEGDDDAPEVTPPTWIFLSTPSARRATWSCRS